MAQKINVLLVDDTDGSQASETVGFGLDGTQYEIDLNPQHASELRALAAPYIEKARKTGGPGRRPAGSRKTGASKADTGRIRDWAREQGIKVNDRGRVPAEIVAQYETANAR